jgi:hypothetical protein
MPPLTGAKVQGVLMWHMTDTSEGSISLVQAALLVLRKTYSLHSPNFFN